MDLRDTEEATRRKFDKDNATTTKKGRRREAMEIPAIQRAAEPLLAPLIKYFEEKPAPDWLAPLIKGLPSTEVALATIAVTLDHIYRGIPHEDRPVDDEEIDPREVGMLIKKNMGERLRSHLASKPAPKSVTDWESLIDWDNEKRVRAGHWVMGGIPSVACVRLNHLGEPEIVRGRKIDVDALREEMMRLDQVFMPFIEEPRDWTGFRKRYGGAFNAKFVRGAPGEHPDMAKLIEQAFLDSGFPHARAVNALKHVPLKVDPAMVEIVEKHGVRILNDDLEKTGRDLLRDYVSLSRELNRIGPPTKSEWSRSRKLREQIKKTSATIRANKHTVEDDVRVARMRDSKPFWLDYNCDFRGRVYAVQHFNYMRGDHVRSLFKFANGIPLTKKGLEWLEVHCANCEGSTEKESYGARQKWVADNKDRILKIAGDPDGTFKDWSKADKPFACIAACRELKAAWEDQAFESHLPIPLDGSCNGIQHLALLIRDANAARLVNLVGQAPQDIYLELALRVRELVNDDDGELAEFWRECFRGLNNRQLRKLCKQPVMTFGYGVTRRGMVRQLAKAYSKLRLRRNSKPPEGAFGYLADQINHVATKELLRGPEKVMQYVKDIADHCTTNGRLMEWASPLGFPCTNRYQKPNVEQITIGSGAVRVRHRVGIGWGKEILVDDVLRGAAPNFVHSQDAAHMAHTVNGFGKDILTVHDSFSCHAENVADLHFKIRAALVGIYLPEDYKDWLAEIRRQNVSSDDILLPPPMGDLDVLQVLYFSPYAF